MNEETSAPVQRCLGQVRSLFYLLDAPITTLIIQAGGETITAHADGQIALDLRALPRGATICVMLRDAPPDCPEVIALNIVADDHMNAPNTASGDGESSIRRR